MFDRKEAKKYAKKNVFSDYVVFTISCLLAAYLGISYTSTLNTAKTTTYDYVDDIAEVDSYESKTITADTVLDKLLEGKVKESQDDSDTLLIEASTGTFAIGKLEFGRRKGALSSFMNNADSGRFVIMLFQVILSVTKSQQIATSIMIVLVAIVTFAISVFVKNVYEVVFRRIFLEGYIYDHVRASRFLFLFKVKKYLKASFTIFVVSIYQFLWDLTVIGGIIKRYSYAMVPYIVAENPDINAIEAIELSRRMMYGYKWELFKVQYSFAGWWLLGFITFGLSSALFSNPYEECVYTAFYVYVRQKAKENGVSYADRLNDVFLYQKASQELLHETYADVVEIMNDDIVLEDYIHTGFRGFIENNFGIIYHYDDKEDGFNIAIEQEEKISEYKHILTGNQYPGRLFPIPVEKRDPRLEHVHYLRHYSIWSIVAMFFVFSFVGWSWEVSLHLVKDGEFINRGVMQGPWLPIYGFGCVFIMLFLYRFRKKPALEAMLTVVLCGVIEYATHWYLELTKGTKWWDYSGYFLNLNGRICAEGLLVFMLGGVAVVYALGPMLDNKLRRLKRKPFIVVCCILMLIFAVDNVYSQKHPNTGKGITDYGEHEVEIIEGNS